MRKPRKNPEYALYKGDTFITIGTARELAEYLGVSERTVHFYSTPTYMKRNKENHYIVIRIDYDEEGDNERIREFYRKG